MSLKLGLAHLLSIHHNRKLNRGARRNHFDVVVYPLYPDPSLVPVIFQAPEGSVDRALDGGPRLNAVVLAIGGRVLLALTDRHSKGPVEAAVGFVQRVKGVGHWSFG